MSGLPRMPVKSLLCEADRWKRGEATDADWTAFVQGYIDSTAEAGVSIAIERCAALVEKMSMESFATESHKAQTQTNRAAIVATIRKGDYLTRQERMASLPMVEKA